MSWSEAYSVRVSNRTLYYFYLLLFILLYFILFLIIYSTMNATLRKDHMHVRDYCVANLNPYASPPDSTDNAVWREFAATAEWLGLVNSHIRFALNITEVLRGDSPTPVMFEHTASMDSQFVLMALVQLMEDPYFRTMRG